MPANLKNTDKKTWFHQTVTEAGLRLKQMFFVLFFYTKESVILSIVTESPVFDITLKNILTTSASYHCEGAAQGSEGCVLALLLCR